MISAYIHIPFCVSKCHYCDFNSIGMGKTNPPETLYVESLRQECERWTWVLNPEARRGFQTVYFGGGTPSLFSPPSIEHILQALSQIASIPAEVEKTLELNPKTAEFEKMKGFQQVGINRLSMGIQTLEPTLLGQLGRAHSVADALQSLEWAFQAGFEKINADLMYGLPRQNQTHLQHTLDQLESFPLKHLSAYELIVEEETEFYDRSLLGKLPLPEVEEVLAMRDQIETFAAQKQMRGYEISNYASPGNESRHNGHYWDYDSYIGLGAGAVSFLCSEDISPEAWAQINCEPDSNVYGLRMTNPRSLTNYQSQAHGLSGVDVELVSHDVAMGEFMMMGLRKREGIWYADFENKFGCPLPKRFMQVICNAVEHGFMEMSAVGCCFTEKGVLLSNEVMQQFL